MIATEFPSYRELIETVPTDPIDRVIRYHVQTKQGRPRTVSSRLEMMGDGFLRDLLPGDVDAECLEGVGVGMPGCES